MMPDKGMAVVDNGATAVKKPETVEESLNQQYAMLFNDLEAANEALNAVQDQQQKLVNKVVGSRLALAQLQKYAVSIGVTLRKGVIPPNELAGVPAGK